MLTHAKGRGGFTLAEMIIVVAVITILIGVSMPGMFEFIKMRDKQLEETRQEEIRRALEGFVAANGKLPSDTGDWATQVAGYTKLSVPQIQNDVWGHPRSYVATAIENKMDSADVLINYATIMSEGADYRVDRMPGIAVSTTNHLDIASADNATNPTGGWWANVPGGQIAGTFSTLKVKAGSDDMLVKFTDYAQKMNGFQDTNKRLERIIQALESYARANYTEWKDYCLNTNPNHDYCKNGLPEKAVYYPLSKPKSYTTYPDQTALYFDSATNTLKPANQLTPVVDNSSDSASTRRDQMKNLMRTLGLPDDHCCSGVEISDDDGGALPFYYNSNPRRIEAGGNCATSRPGQSDLKMPPRITTSSNCD